MNIVTIDGIPVYQALVDDTDATGMLRISLVDDPAVQSNFLTFSKAPQRQQLYAVQDEEKRLVLGVVMRADFPIYRRDPQADGSDFEYYIIYKADTIRAMAEKYLAENRQNMVNLMHEENTDQDGIQMVQYFIKGSGLSPEGFEGIADGSLFAEFHVTNDDVWEDIKAGTYKGFSLEGVFNLAPERDKDFVEEVVDALDGVFSRIFKQSKQYQKMKKKGLLARLARILVEMGNVTTDKGVLAWDGDDELKAGDTVFIEDAEGNRSTAPDGDYTTEDGKVIVVAGGVVSEIKDKAADPAPAPGTEEEEDEAKTITTDKGVLSYTGELAVGTEVSITAEDGTVSAAPDGEYVAEDGRTIVVVDGKVSEIREKAAEEPVVNTLAQRMERVAVALQETYDDKLRKLYDAIVALGFNYPWLVEAGEEFVIACVWSETEGDVYYRFNITEWTEEGEPVLENGVKVVPAYVTPEEKEAAEENLRAVTAAKEAAETKAAELEAQLAKLSKKPAARPAHEEHETTIATTGNKGLDRISSLMGKK